MNDIEKRLRRLEASPSGLYATMFSFLYIDGEKKTLIGKEALSYVVNVAFSDKEHNIVSITPGETVIDIILQISNPAPNRDIEAFGGD